MGRQPSSGAQGCLHLSPVNWPPRTSAPVLSDAWFGLAALAVWGASLMGVSWAYSSFIWLMIAWLSIFPQMLYLVYAVTERNWHGTQSARLETQWKIKMSESIIWGFMLSYWTKVSPNLNLMSHRQQMNTTAPPTTENLLHTYFSLNACVVV